MPALATPADYVRLRDALDVPAVRTVIELPALWHPHRPGESPGWPDPADAEAAQALVNRLPFTARLICYLTAADMLLPRFDAIANQRKLLSHQARAPHVALQRAWAALDGGVSRDELDDAANRVATSSLAGDRDAVLSLCTAVRCAGAEADLHGLVLTAAARAVPDPAAFLQRWWARCRCRLAIRDVADATIANAVADEIAFVMADRQRPSGADTLAPFRGSRCEAIRAAGVIGDPHFVPPLLDALDDPEPGVRLAVVQALAAIGNADALAAVAALSDSDADPAVREAAATATGLLKR